MEAVDTPCICTTLRMTTRTIKRLYDRALAPAELGQTSYSILSRVSAEGPFSISDLADRLAMDRTTCSRELAPLLRAGLVERTVGRDRRERLVGLTSAGRERLQSAIPLWEGVQVEVSAAFGTDQTSDLLAQLRELLRRGESLVA
jgi:DNA-binding MarR family transcriptional regulator